jgi:hypothetical protein
MKWLISVAVAVAMVLGVVAMASPALALELPDPTLLEVPGVTLDVQGPVDDEVDTDIIVEPTTPGHVGLPDLTLPDQCQRGNAPVFPSDEVQGPEDIEDDQTVVDIEDDQTVNPTTPGDVELPDVTLPDQCGRDNAPVFHGLQDSVDDEDAQTVSTGAVVTAS